MFVTTAFRHCIRCQKSVDALALLAFTRLVQLRVTRQAIMAKRLADKKGQSPTERESLKKRLQRKWMSKK